MNSIVDRLLPGRLYLELLHPSRVSAGHKSYSALLAYIIDQLREQKLSLVPTGTDQDNIPSQRVISRARFAMLLT